MVYSESDFIIPALREMLRRDKTGITTAELMQHLRDVLNPTGYDLELAPPRNDDRFSEKVRNLASHKKNLIHTLAAKEEFANGKWHINNAGKKYLNDLDDVDVALRNQGFTSTQRIKILKSPNNQIFIEEGEVSITHQIIRKRSTKLREEALKNYSEKDGRIICRGCGFEGSKTYGESGQGLIEIHHLEPISTTQKNIKIAIKEALLKVTPLCPNCHRLVHKEKDNLLSLADLNKMTDFKYS